MYYKNETEFKSSETCIQKFVLTGAESIPDVDVGKKKFALNIILPSSDDTGEIRLVFENVSRTNGTRPLFIMVTLGGPQKVAVVEMRPASTG